MAKIKGTACLQVTGVLPVIIDKRREVDGTCCDANRIALLSKLLEDKVRVTAIRRWGSNRYRNATTSIHLEVFAVTEGSKERLFLVVGSDLLHLDPHSYIETERDLDETIVSLLQIPVHEVPVGHASSSWKLPADEPRLKVKRNQ
jgi:hypothetical protein